MKEKTAIIKKASVKDTAIYLKIQLHNNPVVTRNFFCNFFILPLALSPRFLL
jgi:hypothetical protein